jgi:hypothetical protein
MSFPFFLYRVQVFERSPPPRNHSSNPETTETRWAKFQLAFAAILHVANSGTMHFFLEIQTPNAAKLN